MITIVGVDAKQTFKPVLCLLTKLNFENCMLELLHAANPVFPFMTPDGSDAGLQTEYLKAIEALGSEALNEASNVSCTDGFPTRTKMVFGSAASSIIEEAGLQRAQLVAVTATHHGSLSCSFLGSVSRALAVACPASVLIAKSPIEDGEPLKVVFATDHSPFSERCLEQFIAMKPHGVTHVHVVSAYDINDHEAEVLIKNLPSLGGDVDRWIEEQVETENEKVCRRLNAAGYVTTSSASRGRPIDVIHQAMTDTKANLLVVGSHGKGFISRALIGSVSLHQVVSEPYSVLVIRP
jgi:nucleotide-binding universal stress UspA family protein